MYPYAHRITMPHAELEEEDKTAAMTSTQTKPVDGGVHLLLDQLWNCRLDRLQTMQNDYVHIRLNLLNSCTWACHCFRISGTVAGFPNVLANNSLSFTASVQELKQPLFDMYHVLPRQRMAILLACK